MATIEQALRDLVLADSAVSARVGTRMYPYDDLPQDWVSPSLTYMVATEQTQREVGGPSKHTHARAQIDCWARDDYEASLLLSLDVKAAIDGFVGSKSSVDIRAVVCTDRQPMHEKVESLQVHRYMLEFSIKYANPR